MAQYKVIRVPEKQYTPVLLDAEDNQGWQLVSTHGFKGPFLTGILSGPFVTLTFRKG